MQLEWLIFPAWALLALGVLGTLYLATAAWAVRRVTRRRPAPLRVSIPVTILKPLHGTDFELEANLRSFCAQDYAPYQVVFGVADPNDSAVPVVRRLIADLPERDLALTVGGPAAPNRKVANLTNMLPQAKYPLLVIADSDMRVRPDYLATVAAEFADPQIGMATCLYRGVSAGGPWSRLACLHVNNGFLPQAAVGEVLGAGDGAFGATMALHRATLEAAGGFESLAYELADDHALGVAVRGLGRQVALSPVLVDNLIFEPSFMALFRHELRWARTVRLVVPWGYAGTLVTHPAALAALALCLGVPAVWGWPVLGLALVIRGVTVRLNDRALGLSPSPLWLIPPRDLLSFVVFIGSFFTRSVAWRDRRFRIGRGGRLTLDGDSTA